MTSSSANHDCSNEFEDDEITFGSAPMCPLMEKDAALGLEAQAAMHYEVIENLVPCDPFEEIDLEEVIQQIHRARAFLNRGVPIALPSPASAAPSSSEDSSATSSLAVQDARRPGCFDELIRRPWPRGCADQIYDLMLCYFQLGYLDVNFIYASGTPEKGTLLECAVLSDNAWAAVTVIDAGADLSRVPLEDTKVDGVVVPAGQFRNWIASSYGQRTVMATWIDDALLNRASHDAASIINTAIRSSAEVIKPGSNSSSKGNSAEGGDLSHGSK